MASKTWWCHAELGIRRVFALGRIAQLVEQLTLNQRVPGSSPGAPTKIVHPVSTKPQGLSLMPCEFCLIHTALTRQMTGFNADGPLLTRSSDRTKPRADGVEHYSMGAVTMNVRRGVSVNIANARPTISCRVRNCGKSETSEYVSCSICICRALPGETTNRLQQTTNRLQHKSPKWR